MDDLISRRAAIEAIEQLNIPEDMCVFEILSHIQLAIGTLPSAQPEHLVKKTGNLVKGLVNDCISRQAAIDALAEQIMESALMDNPTTASTDIDSYRPIAELSLRDVPSAQPEIMKSSDLIRRQEAIEICNDAVNFWDGTSGVTGILSVRDEIAKLDSAQPTQNNTSNALKSLDCIDRQAAIDALNRHLDTIPVVNNNTMEMIRRSEVMDCREIINGLPSAEVRTEMSSANDTISRQAAIDAINKAFERVFAWDGTSPLGDKVLENLPSAQPEKMQLSTEKMQLSEEDATKDATFDYIDRQAAIDALCDNCDDVKAVCAHFPCKQCIAIEQLPSAQPERLTDDDFETIRIHLNAYKESLGNQHRWEEAEEYQRIIDRFMAFASAQPEQIARNIATIIENEQDMRVILKNAEHTETHSCDYQHTVTHGWIPVTERLPEEKQDVLLAFKHNMVVGFWEDILNDGGQAWYANSGNGWFTGTEAVDDDGFPLAWMPLPEPYKEGQDEQAD